MATPAIIERIHLDIFKPSPQTKVDAFRNPISIDFHVHSASISIELMALSMYSET